MNNALPENVQPFFISTKAKVSLQQRNKVILAFSFPYRREGFCTALYCDPAPGILLETPHRCTNVGRARTFKACSALDL